MPTIRIDIERLRKESRGERGEVWSPELPELGWVKGEIVDVCEVRKVPFLNMEGYSEMPVFRVRAEKTGEEVCVTPLFMRKFKRSD